MLVVSRVGMFSQNYDIHQDGRPLTRLELPVWGREAAFVLSPQRFTVRSNFWGTEWYLYDPARIALATATSPRRRNWHVQASGVTYTFHRTAVLRMKQQLLQNSQPVGYIDQPSIWKHQFVAELPTMPLPLQIFSLAVIMMVLRQQQQAASA